MVKEQVENPSDQWMGCSWPLTVYKSHYVVGGTAMLFSTSIRLIGNYRDSERMDVNVTFEQPDHTFRTYMRKDVPVILRENIPTADIEFTFTSDETIGVPTVESSEKGGKRTATHIYK